MNIQVRPLLADDYDQWFELWQGYLNYYRTDLSADMTALTWQRLLDETSGIFGYGAVNAAGELSGFVHYLFHPVTWAKGPRCYLEDLFTSETARGQGVGRALIEAVYATAKDKGADQVYWLTEDYNTRAHYLYDKLAVKTPFIKYQNTL